MLKITRGEAFSFCPATPPLSTNGAAVKVALSGFPRYFLRASNIKSKFNFLILLNGDMCDAKVRFRDRGHGRDMRTAAYGCLRADQG
jgi:hypothetical protein